MTQGREALAAYALARVPKLLTLQDRQPHSVTYGCYDRAYWHLRVKDFPSGMAQCFVAPLALVWALDLPDNPWRGDAALRAWIEAGVRYAARSSHPSGACDDYFPFEQAAGAAAFSLLACLDACALIGLDDPELTAFFVRRARWLGTHQESGRLSNHEALIALCLTRTARLTNDAALARLAQQRIGRLLSWRHEEGWFAEYEGCDPGYLTLTLSLLARLNALDPDPALTRALREGVAFAAHFVHPDGSFGGEYGSRNTLNFFPHAFEVAGAQVPEALGAVDRFYAALALGQGACYDDDHIIAHHMTNYLLAWQDFQPRAEAAPPAPETRQRWFPGAQLLVEQAGAFSLYAGLNKGGAFKLFCGDDLLASDTQISLQVREGRKTRTAVAHLLGQSRAVVADGEISVEGSFAWAKTARMTPLKMLILRAVMLAGGRFFPDFIRRILQKLLITHPQPAPFRFRRTLRLTGAGLRVEDEVTAQQGWGAVTAAGIGGAQTSIYIVVSRLYHPHQRKQPWRDLTPEVRALTAEQPLRLMRTFAS